MKNILVVGMLLASSVAAASQKVQVTGVGYNLEQARINAMEKAVMRVCKSAVVSDKEFRDRKVTRSKVAIYNGCLVKNYTVDDEYTSTDLTKVTITAEVIQNHLPDRIIQNSSEWFFYDLNQHKDRVTQLRLRLAQARNMINEVFLDFPHSAFELKQSDYSIDYKVDRGYMKIPFELSWNKNYLNSLNDLFEVLMDKQSYSFKPSPENIVIERPWVSNSFGFNDSTLTSQVRTTIASHKPFIRIRLLDISGRESVNVCYEVNHIHNLYKLTELYWLRLNSVGTIKDTIVIPLPDNIPDNLELSMDVTTRSFCKNFI